MHIARLSDRSDFQPEDFGGPFTPAGGLGWDGVAPFALGFAPGEAWARIFGPDGLVVNNLIRYVPGRFGKGSELARFALSKLASQRVFAVRRR